MTPDVATDADLAGSLDAGLARLGIPLDRMARDALIAYVGLLAKWNRTYNLTAIREPQRMVTQHLLDSLAVLPVLDRLVDRRTDVRVLDVGSGAGLPGIPIAVARPAWQVVMLEPVHKKCAFITQAVAELRLRNAKAVSSRVEDYAVEPAATIAVSRAFADLASFAESSSRHVDARGALVAMKGVHPDEELRELPDTFEVVSSTPLTVPGLDAARHAIVLRRRSAA